MKPSSAAAPGTARDRLGLAARLVLGLALAVSGTLKAASPAEEFAVIIANYNILPSPMVMTAAHVLPWLETLAGFALLFGCWTRAASCGAGLLLAGFMIAILSAKFRGYHLPNCGCFGEGLHLSATQALGLDAFLACCAFFSFSTGAAMVSLDNWMYNAKAGLKTGPR